MVFCTLVNSRKADGIVRFEAGGQLVDQAGWHLDQGILVTGQGFESRSPDRYQASTDANQPGQLVPSW